MPENPLISIVLPIHNEARWLDQCFKSLQCQTYSNYEVVFIDDASTDNSWDLIRNLQNSYPAQVTSFHFEKNRGEGAARNKGIELAKGIFILETDADAIFPENFLEKVFQTYATSNADGLSLGYLKVHPDRKGILADYWRAKRNASKIIREAGKKDAIASMFFFKKETAEFIGGYDARVPSGTDFDFGMRARQKGLTIVHASEVFFYHADVVDWQLFYRRLFNAARYDMPIKKRWGQWLSTKQIIKEYMQAVTASVLLLLGITGIVYPAFFLSWVLLFLIEGLTPFIFHKETRLIASLSYKNHYWNTLVLLPFITFLRIRASNYGKVYALLFPVKTARSVTFDV